MRYLLCLVILQGVACGEPRGEKERGERASDHLAAASEVPSPGTTEAQAPKAQAPKAQAPKASPPGTAEREEQAPEASAPGTAERKEKLPSQEGPAAGPDPHIIASGNSGAQGTSMGEASPRERAQGASWPRGETRRAEAIFSTWIATQRILSDRDLAAFPVIDERLDRRVRRSVPTALRRRLLPLLPEAPSVEGTTWREGWQKLFREMDRDMPAFVRRLREGPFATEETEREDGRLGRRVLRDAYYHFLSAFFDGRGERERQMGLHALGTRVFEYCVSEKTHHKLLALARDPRTRPVARLLYLVIWQNVSRMGWRHWHEDALGTLKARHDAGDEIVYVAGGVDLYTLLTHGIHRIRLIDPLYPSQAYYYSKGWDFLIRSSASHGGLGDRILFASKRFYLQRARFEEKGVMETGRLSSGARLTLPLGETEWWVMDASHNRIGRVIIERRLARQEDFNAAPGRVLLMSFNEMHFLTYEGHRGWGIRPEGFPEGFQLHIKQLRRPVTREILLRLRHTDRVFGEVQLGNNVD